MVKKDILKNLTSYDTFCSILLSKPKDEYRFDAKILYDAISGSSEKYKDLGHLLAQASMGTSEIDRMMSVLRMGHTIFQYSSDLTTEVYNVNDHVRSAIVADLEKRLGKEFLKNFEPVAKEVWDRYDSLASQKVLELL